MLGRIVDERRAQGALVTQGAKLFGRGIYGLEEVLILSRRARAATSASL